MKACYFIQCLNQLFVAGSLIMAVHYLNMRKIEWNLLLYIIIFSKKAKE